MLAGQRHCFVFILRLLLSNSDFKGSQSMESFIILVNGYELIHTKAHNHTKIHKAESIQVKVGASICCFSVRLANDSWGSL